MKINFMLEIYPRIEIQNNKFKLYKKRIYKLKNLADNRYKIQREKQIHLNNNQIIYLKLKTNMKQNLRIFEKIIYFYKKKFLIKKFKFKNLLNKLKI